MSGLMTVLFIGLFGSSLPAFAWSALFYYIDEEGMGKVLLKSACILLSIGITALITAIIYSGG